MRRLGIPIDKSVMSDINKTISTGTKIGNLGFPADAGAGSMGARYLRLNRLRSSVAYTGGTHRVAFAGLFLFTLLLYVRPNEMFPEVFGTFPMSKIVAATAVFAYLASKLARGEVLTIKPFELKMLAVIALLGLAFAPLAAAPMDSVDVLLDMFIKVVIIFVLMINVVTTRKRLRSMVTLVVVCGTIFGFLAIKSYLVGDFTILEKRDVGVVGLRITGAVGGFFGNPNDLAMSLNMLLPLGIALALLSSGLKRIFFFACCIILTAGVIVTFSRGGFLGLLTIGGVLLWKAGRKNRTTTAMAFAVLFAVFVLAMPGGYAGRITSMFNIGEDPTGSSQARRDLLDRALNVAVHHPIVGIGMGNFHIYSIHEQVAHNSYLEIAAELGFAGLMAYLLLIFAPLRSLRRIEREHKVQDSRSARSARIDPGGTGKREIHQLSIALQGVLFAYIVCSFFGSIQYQWSLYYPVAYAIVLRRIHESEQSLSDVTDKPTDSKPEATRPVGILWRRNRGVAERTVAARSRP
jgi:O-antigen ligase